jgi:starvation-inducible DNA-binding protein
MEQLIEKMDRLLASTFALYLKAHQFHWNVEGQDFHQYHDFFGDLYEEIFASVDTTAEQIRALDSKVKGTMSAFRELSVIRDQVTDIDIQEMNAMLYRDVEALIAVLTDVHEEASKQKHCWMLRASIAKGAATNEEVAQPEVTTYEIQFNK